MKLSRPGVRENEGHNKETLKILTLGVKYIFICPGDLCSKSSSWSITLMHENHINFLTPKTCPPPTKGYLLTRWYGLRWVHLWCFTPQTWDLNINVLRIWYFKSILNFYCTKLDRVPMYPFWLRWTFLHVQNLIVLWI